MHFVSTQFSSIQSSSTEQQNRSIQRCFGMTKRRLVLRLSHMLRVSPLALRWIAFISVSVFYISSRKLIKNNFRQLNSNNELGQNVSTIETLAPKHKEFLQTNNNHVSNQQLTCHKNVCHKTDPQKLNIHIVPHTHDDTGWLKTVDVYYQDQVQYILSNVVIELERNPDRRFIYVEIAFFERWWRHQSVKTKELVKRLVDNGQFQFTLGHWSMPDEAVTHYNDIITNAELGMRFLEENFGDCGRPLVAWQIDPFGHSRAIMEMYRGRVGSFERCSFSLTF